MLWTLLLLLMQLAAQATACYFNLDQTARSLEDLAEAAPIALTGRVLATTTTTSSAAARVGRYSAAIRVVEVLKGRSLLVAAAAGFGNASASSSDDANDVVTVDGFGDPVACLSEAHPGDWLLFFLSAVLGDHGGSGGREGPRAAGRLQAHYTSASSAVAQMTSGNLARVSRALGWHTWTNWTACSRPCGPQGVAERSRGCSGPPCDYGDSRQSRWCNRWPCESMQPVAPVPPGNKSTGSIKNNSTSKTAAVFSLNNSLSDDAALALTLRLVDASLTVSAAAAPATVATLTLRRSPDVAGLMTLTAVSAPMTEAAVVWTRPIESQSISIFLTVKNGVLVFATGCWLTGQVPLTVASAASVAMETAVALTPAEALLSSALVPWSVASNCTEELLKTPPPTYWTAWSPCSATCGEGTRNRQAACRLELARCHLEPGLSRSDTGQCPSLPLCNPDLAATGSHRCRCLNGGFCFQSRCLCPTTFAGESCEIPLAAEPEAVSAVTSLPPPSRPPRQPPPPPPPQPEQPSESARRRHRSDCRRSSSRRRRPRCRNGGVCDPASGACRCQMGWTGGRCQTAQCRPRCRNGGACVQPNLCACAEGFSGTQCQIVDCYPPCVNGGTCVQPGKCACPPGYRGKFCHRVRCHRNLCLNGGRCLEADGLCRCPAEFYGPRCERRNCAPELSYRKTYRPVVKRLRRPSVQPCSPGAKEYCLVNSVRRIVVFKIVLRPYFTCPP